MQIFKQMLLKCSNNAQTFTLLEYISQILNVICKIQSIVSNLINKIITKTLRQYSPLPNNINLEDIQCRTQDITLVKFSGFSLCSVPSFLCFGIMLESSLLLCSQSWSVFLLMQSQFHQLSQTSDPFHDHQMIIQVSHMSPFVFLVFFCLGIFKKIFDHWGKVGI